MTYPLLNSFHSSFAITFDETSLSSNFLFLSLNPSLHPQSKLLTRLRPLLYHLVDLVIAQWRMILFFPLGHAPPLTTPHPSFHSPFCEFFSPYHFLSLIRPPLVQDMLFTYMHAPACTHVSTCTCTCVRVW